MSAAAEAPASDLIGAIDAVFAEIHANTGAPLTLYQRPDGSYFWAVDGENMCEPTDPASVLASVKLWRNRLVNEKAVERINGASPTKSKRRGRPKDPAVEGRRKALIEIVKTTQPATVRQIFYLAEIRGLVPKSEEGYRHVQHDLVLLRREGRIPYGWITDSTRLQRKPTSYGSVEEALEATAALYRKSLWRDAGSYVEIWVEKLALSGVIYPVTAAYDVRLMAAKGYASLSFLHSAAEDIATLDVPAYIYHLGDYDPSGQDAARAIEQTIREMAPGSEIHFTRLAVTPEQIAEWNLPTRPTKETDSRAKKFGSDVSVELDSIEPERLRELVEEAILQHLDQDQIEVLKRAEQSEREILMRLAGGEGSVA